MGLMGTDLWSFRGEVGNDRANLQGMTVEAVDGKLGKVEEVAGTPDGGKYLVVDTGLPLVGKTVILPAGLVSGIDVDDEVIRVERTQDELKDAPSYDAEHRDDPTYLESVTRHFGALKPKV